MSEISLNPATQQAITQTGHLTPEMIRLIQELIEQNEANKERISALEGGTVSVDNEPLIAQAINQIFTTFGDTVSVESKGKDLEKWGTNEAVGTSKAVIMTLKAGTDVETMLTSNGITTVISDDAADTMDILFVEGHTYSAGSLTSNSSGNNNITLTGTTAKSLTTPLARTTRARIEEPANGNIYFYEGGATTSGVPNAGSEIHLIIPAGETQTQKCATSISSTDYWIIREAHVSVLEKTSAWAQFRLEIKAASADNSSWYPITGWIGASDASGSVSFFNNGGYVIVPKNHDVRMVAFANTTGVYCSARMKGPLALVS